MEQGTQSLPRRPHFARIGWAKGRKIPFPQLFFQKIRQIFSTFPHGYVEILVHTGFPAEHLQQLGPQKVIHAPLGVTELASPQALTQIVQTPPKFVTFGRKQGLIGLFYPMGAVVSRFPVQKQTVLIQQNGKQAILCVVFQHPVQSGHV